MLEAVNTIHEERIVHSDLKPANFLLVRGSLKLIDFGIAKAISSDTTNIQRDSQVRRRPFSDLHPKLVRSFLIWKAVQRLLLPSLGAAGGHAELHVPRGVHVQRAGRRREHHQVRPAVGHLVPGVHSLPDGLRQDAVRRLQDRVGQVQGGHRPEPPNCVRAGCQPVGDRSDEEVPRLGPQREVADPPAAPASVPSSSDAPRDGSEPWGCLEIADPED